MKQQGFTLIEIMMTVAILALLVLIALPAYLDYAARTKVAGGLYLSEPVKTAVFETQQTSGHFPTNNTEAAVSNLISTDVVESITVSDGGVITITYINEELGYADEENYTLVLTPTKLSEGSVRWDCLGGSLPTRLRPGNCR